MKIIDGHDVIEHAEVNGERREFIRILMDYIEDAPVVEPKQGEWIIHGEPPLYVKECSACGAKFFHHAFEDPTPYCAECGARMLVAVAEEFKRFLEEQEGADDE